MPAAPPPCANVVSMSTVAGSTSVAMRDTLAPDGVVPEPELPDGTVGKTPDWPLAVPWLRAYSTPAPAAAATTTATTTATAKMGPSCLSPPGAGCGPCPGAYG